MLAYPADFTPAEEGGFVVTFPDIPEAITEGDDEQDAIRCIVCANSKMAVKSLTCGGASKTRPRSARARRSGSSRPPIRSRHRVFPVALMSHLVDV